MADVETISVTLPPDMLTVVREAVDAGEYASSGDVVRDALQEWTESRKLKQMDNNELRRLWFQAIEDDRPPADADEVFDRLERKYQEMADNAAGVR